MHQEHHESNSHFSDFQAVSEHFSSSKTSHIDDILIQKLESALHTQTSEVSAHEIAKISLEHDPIDLAYTVYRLPASARYLVYSHLSGEEAKMRFLINTDRNTRVAIVRYIDIQELVSLIEKMPTDEAVSLIDDMPRRYIRRVLERLSPKKGSLILDLQRHEINTAGRLMTNEFFAFFLNTSIGEAAAFIRDHPGIDLTRCVFVVNEQGELKGQVPVRNLIFNPPHYPLKQVMQAISHEVTPDATRDEVVDVVERYKIASLPVVNESKKLVGMISNEDVVEAMEDITDDTIAHIAGTGEDLSAHDPIYRRFLSRAPWLTVTLIAGILNAVNVSYFETLVERGVLLFFLPFLTLINGMSGNVGLQSSTVLVRGMATGMLSSKSRKEAIYNEISIGCLSGMTFGFACGLLVYFLNTAGVYNAYEQAFKVGVTVSLGLTSACIVATLLGVFSPLFFNRIGVDPAVASGPIVTACNDVSAIVMYFLVVHLMSSWFLVV